MEKQIRKIKLGEEEERDLQYWQSKTPAERVSMVQELREQYIRLFNKEEEYNEAKEAVRQVYKVTKRT